MKNTKKVPAKQLEKFSNIFTQLGLVLVLFIVYVALEHKTEQKTVIGCDFSNKSKLVYVEPNTEVLFTKEPKIVPKLEIVKAIPFLVDEVVKGDNTILETIIDNTPIENIEIIDIDNVVEVKIKETIIEDVPFDFVQNAPVFKGCENLSKEDNKVCFDKKMKQFVQRNFDVGLANELGLHSGNHKIFTQFVIDNYGNVVDIKVRTTSKSLKREAVRLIKKLPKFKPGKQNDKFVKVRYSLPIAFSIE